ncbi:hypothetical protein PGT21_012555 [Puccinia graminis f. sp. tritici]|uniref:Uncharacterized protein n=1 Tax=Puccinia graminis f. sp. tritici TaxID=56615 RepID=A0A5B0QNC1_PUCGR|nr:hypothetical protein PGT21_012555 [Puccinia graminis f. sp. tritici]
MRQVFGCLYVLPVLPASDTPIDAKNLPTPSPARNSTFRGSAGLFTTGFFFVIDRRPNPSEFNASVSQCNFRFKAAVYCPTTLKTVINKLDIDGLDALLFSHSSNAHSSPMSQTMFTLQRCIVATRPLRNNLLAYTFAESVLDPSSFLNSRWFCVRINTVIDKPADRWVLRTRQHSVIDVLDINGLPGILFSPPLVPLAQQYDISEIDPQPSLEASLLISNIKGPLVATLSSASAAPSSSWSRR